MSGNGQDVENEAPPSEQGANVVDPPLDEEKAALSQRILDLEARLRTVSAAFKEKQDEIQGTKERLARHAQVEEEIRRGEVVTALFEPVENLSRSIQANRALPEETVAGLKMVHAEFMSALKKLGLEETSGVGANFDPNNHEAIATQPVADPEQDNKVIMVYSTGYRIGKRLVRPARVVIGRYEEPIAEA